MTSRAPSLEEQLRRSIHQVRAKKVRMNDQVAIVKAEQQGRMAASVVVHGDLSAMNDNQLATYYVELCRSLDLNPLTRPFTLLKLNGKLIYYANKDCSDQLRKRDKVSVRIVGRETVGELLVVTAEAAMPDGRVDQAIGALPVGNLKGEALANAMMKAETKAKRRVTLSICGLGMMDESELEGAESAGFNDQAGAASVTQAMFDGEAPNAGMSDDAATFMARMTKTLEDIKSDVHYCKTWDEVARLRARLGSKAKPAESELLRQLQHYGPDKRIISGSQYKDLSKIWQHCDRQLTALEGKLKPPPVEDSFTDEPDGTEAFAAREPGADEDEDLL